MDSAPRKNFHPIHKPNLEDRTDVLSFLPYLTVLPEFTHSLIVVIHSCLAQIPAEDYQQNTPWRFFASTNYMCKYLGKSKSIVYERFEQLHKMGLIERHGQSWQKRFYNERTGEFSGYSFDPMKDWLIDAWSEVCATGLDRPAKERVNRLVKKTRTLREEHFARAKSIMAEEAEEKEYRGQHDDTYCDAGSNALPPSLGKENTPTSTNARVTTFPEHLRIKSDVDDVHYSVPEPDVNQDSAPPDQDVLTDCGRFTPPDGKPDASRSRERSPITMFLNYNPLSESERIRRPKNKAHRLRLRSKARKRWDDYPHHLIDKFAFSSVAELLEQTTLSASTLVRQSGLLCQLCLISERAVRLCEKMVGTDWVALMVAIISEKQARTGGIIRNPSAYLLACAKRRLAGAFRVKPTLYRLLTQWPA